MKDGKNEIAIKTIFRKCERRLKKDGIDKKANCYIDLKYISKASGTAYLGALKALLYF